MKAYTRKDTEGLKIHKDALQVVYGLDIGEQKQPFKPLLNGVEEKKEVTAEMKVIEILKEQLDVANKSNEKKDEIISQLNERLAESNRMLDQQQQLSALDKKRILELEGAKEENQQKEQKEQEQKKGKGIFALFRNIKKE